MSLDEVVLAGLIVSFLGFMLIEALMPAKRAMPVIPRWRLIGVAGFIVSMFIFTATPLLILPLLGDLRLLDLTGWSGWGAIPVVMLTTFFTYWSHRIQHRFDLLWRLGHQLHHGVARIDIASAFIFHPVDVFVQAFWTVMAGALLGVTPIAGAIAGVLGTWPALYQHWNVNTPRWTNWIFQRPEAHMLHHELGVHSRNFGDMPIWDMLFGTYANPVRADDVRVGFEEGRARRWLAMLAFVDVNRAQGRDRF